MKANEDNIISEVHGENEGSICGRNNCLGIIELHEPENCSCHIDPPCAACLEPREFCPICGWEVNDEC